MGSRDAQVEVLECSVSRGGKGDTHAMPYTIDTGKRLVD